MRKDYRSVEIGHLMIGEKLNKDFVIVDELLRTLEDLILQNEALIERNAKLSDELVDYRVRESRQYESDSNCYLGERIRTI